MLAAGIIVCSAFAAYHSIFSAPFVFDDIPAIVDNPTIRSFGSALSPPTDQGTSAIGRPVYNLSLAVNYALGGLDVRGYHAANVLIHTLAGLLLFGLVRRTLQAPALRERFDSDALLLALGTALLWTVHPLQTESVTLTVQRTESLMGLFFFLTLYAFARGAAAAGGGASFRGIAWFALSFIACLLGIGTKEVTAIAPLLVLLYDRTFLGGTFRAAWQARGRVHLALFATWLPLAWLMVGTSNRGGTVGLGLGTSAWTYLLTQCQAVVMYLKLSFWPHPLVMDYGSETVRRLADVFPQALLLLALFGATLLALWRRPVLGFLGAWFFAILAPSSSFVPLRTQTMAEHRMYLPLAAVLVLLVTVAYTRFGRRSVLVLFALAAAAGFATVDRNRDYRSAVAIWTDTVEKSPGSARAHYNFGVVLSAAGRFDEAVVQFESALAIEPDYREHTKLAVALAKINRLPEAVAHFEAALRLNPDFAEAHDQYGVALGRARRPAEALPHHETAVRLDPTSAVKQYHLANTLLLLERPAAAIAHYEAALRLDPANAGARANLELARQALKPSR